MLCSILGSFNAPKSIEDSLKVFIFDMIEQRNVDTFAITNFGSFSVFAANALAEAKSKYPDIKCKLITIGANRGRSFRRLEEYTFFERLEFNEIGLFHNSIATMACTHIMTSFSDIIAVYGSKRIMETATNTCADVYQIF